MQVALTPSSAAEVRLIAAFMQDFADLLETQTVQPPVSNAHVAPGCAPFAPLAEEPAAPKRTRAKKETSATTAETPAASGSPETAAPATEGNDAAATAAESTEAQAGSTSSASEAGQSADSAPAAEAMTHDRLRVLFGELTQRGEAVKQAIVTAFKELGYPNIKAIPVDELQHAHDIMVKAAN